MDAKARYRQARKITFIGAVINAFLGVIKVVFGVLGQSSALVADGIHSFSDLLTDVLVIIASRFGSQAADIDHPYGHGRIETAATMFLAMLLIVAGLGIIADGFWHIFFAQAETPSSYVLAIALLSVLANEALFHATKFVAHKIKSELILANAWHHRSDALSSLVVLIGVGGALLGYLRLDAIAAIIVGGMVARMGWQLGWSSIRELVDTGVDEHLLEAMCDIIKHVPGVEALHQLRTRSMGGHILVDVHIIVSPRISVSEGHHIGQQVHFNLRDKIKSVNDVTVHIDPEDDEVNTPSRHLPDRSQLESQLFTLWQGLSGADQIKGLQIHYLAGRVEVDVCLPVAVVADKNTLDVLLQQYQQAVDKLDDAVLVRLMAV